MITGPAAASSPARANPAFVRDMRRRSGVGTQESGDEVPVLLRVLVELGLDEVLLPGFGIDEVDPDFRDVFAVPADEYRVRAVAVAGRESEHHRLGRVADRKK